jgi:cytochrome P450 family 142 subfamily A polypeptide 1
VTDVNLISGEFWGSDPHEELAHLREHDPVHWDGAVWGITKHADVRYVSTHPETFSSSGGIRPDAAPVPQMLDMDDPAHRVRRRLVSTGFTPRRVAAQRERIVTLVDNILDRVVERGECDFVRDIAAWLPIEVIGEALGVAPEDYPTLLEWSDTLLTGMVGGDGKDAHLAKTAQTFSDYVAYVSRVIADRREAPLDDLISVLVHAQVEGDRLSDQALLYESLSLLVAGDETSRHVMTGGVFQLLTDRDRWEQVRRDRDLMPTTVEEMLRWVSPIKNMARTVTQEVEMRGKVLTPGEKVLLLYPSANRDKDVFEHPFTFDVARSPNDHLAFGVGPHFCLGASLARLEITVLVDRLLERLPDLELVESTEPAYRPANFVSGYEDMPVRFTPRAPLGTSRSR